MNRPLRRFCVVAELSDRERACGPIPPARVFIRLTASVWRTLAYSIFHKHTGHLLLEVRLVWRESSLVWNRLPPHLEPTLLPLQPLRCSRIIIRRAGIYPQTFHNYFQNSCHAWRIHNNLVVWRRQTLFSHNSLHRRGRVLRGKIWSN